MPATFPRKPLFSQEILSSALILVISMGAPAHAQTAKASTPACRVAEKFLGYLNAQNAKAIGELFAAKAAIVGPDGKTHTDPAEFVALEEKGFKSMEQPWRFQILNLAPYGKNGCFMEFSVSDKEGVPFQPGAVDRFEVNEAGKITTFLPYFAAAWAHRAVENMNKPAHAEPAKP